jgi:hypothetical protein
MRPVAGAVKPTGRKARQVGTFLATPTGYMSAGSEATAGRRRETQTEG